MKFLRDVISREEIFNKDVLEVGSQDVNGSPREVLAPLGPRTYWGVDYGPGKSVDLVLDATKLVSHFGRSAFDVVISTEMLEHAEDWRASISQMKEVLRPGGLLVLSARGPGFPYHGFPHDHWRYTVKDFQAIFADMKIDVIKEDLFGSPGVLLKAVKILETGGVDLSKIEVQPVPVPPEMIQVEGRVDILVANWNTLPWLRLLNSQIQRFHPRIPHELFVWDNASDDGSVEWLRAEGIRHHAGAVVLPHAESLHQAMDLTNAPYVAFMDVDAIPTWWFWLDQAIGLLQDREVGAVGLAAGSVREYHRRFVHASFSVFRRDLYRTLDLRPHLLHDEKTDYEACETLCRKIEDAGYRLAFVGDTQIDLAHRKDLPNRVIHAFSSTPVLAEKRSDMPFIQMVNEVVRWHRLLLADLGIWGEFEGYAKDSASKNPLCLRYVDKDV